MINEIIRFVNDDFQLDVRVSPNKETVWLNRNQLASLFDRDVKTISKHINNALKEDSRNIKRVIDNFELEEFTK